MILGPWRVWLLLIAAAARPASAAESGEAYLFRRCAAIPAAAAAADAACVNYVYGVLNQLPSGPSGAALRRSTCFPQVLAPAQASAIVENYARNHPERRGVGAATLRAEAFSAAFPCKSN